MLHPETGVTVVNKSPKPANPVIIEGVQYFSAAEVARELRISRQTLWRWRREGKISLGHRYRNGLVLFTEDEFRAIWAYANLLQPINSENRDQMRLFNGGKKV